MPVPLQCGLPIFSMGASAFVKRIGSKLADAAWRVAKVLWVGRTGRKPGFANPHALTSGRT